MWIVGLKSAANSDTIGASVWIIGLISAANIDAMVPACELFIHWLSITGIVESNTHPNKNLSYTVFKNKANNSD